MARIDLFTMRVNVAERKMIRALAERLQRSQSDAVRLLIRQAARGILTDAPAPKADAAPRGEGVKNAATN